MHRPINLLYAQSGGATATINASAAGVIETARRHADRIGRIYAARNGILGLLNEDLIDTGDESDAAIAALRHTPGAAFGSCRFKLADAEQDPASYARMLTVLRAHDIRVSSTTAAAIRPTPASSSAATPPARATRCRRF